MIMFDPNKPMEDNRKYYEMAEAANDAEELKRQQAMAIQLQGSAIKRPERSNAFTAIAQGLTGYMAGERDRKNKASFDTGRSQRVGARGSWFENTFGGGSEGKAPYLSPRDELNQNIG